MTHFLLWLGLSGFAFVATWFGLWVVKSAAIACVSMGFALGLHSLFGEEA